MSNFVNITMKCGFLPASAGRRLMAEGDANTVTGSFLPLTVGPLASSWLTAVGHDPPLYEPSVAVNQPRTTVSGSCDDPENRTHAVTILLSPSARVLSDRRFREPVEAPYQLLFPGARRAGRSYLA